MNKLYYYNATYGQIFWDESNTIIDVLHENDCDFSEEYLEKLFDHFNIKIQYVGKRPNWITHQQLVDCGIEE